MRAKVEAEVQSKTVLTLTDAHVVSFKNTFGDLSDEINRKITAGENVKEEWFLDEAAQPDSPYRYILVYRAITADSTKLEFDKNAEIGGIITVPVGGWSGDVKVKVVGYSSSVFRGEDVTTIVDYYVIKPYLSRDDEGNVTFKFRLDTICF